MCDRQTDPLCDYVHFLNGSITLKAEPVLGSCHGVSPPTVHMNETTYDPSCQKCFGVTNITLEARD
jgi:hypothetical protein